MRIRGSVPHTRHINPGVLCQKDQPPKHLALKSNKVYVQENHETIGN